MSSKESILAALRGKPTRFELGELVAWLRPMRHADRTALIGWNAAHKDDPDAGVTLQRKIVAAVLTDEGGQATFTEEEVGTFDTAAVDAIAEEAAARAGLNRERAINGGKGPSPTTPS